MHEASIKWGVNSCFENQLLNKQPQLKFEPADYSDLVSVLITIFYFIFLFVDDATLVLQHHIQSIMQKKKKNMHKMESSRTHFLSILNVRKKKKMVSNLIENHTQIHGHTPLGLRTCVVIFFSPHHFM